VVLEGFPSVDKHDGDFVIKLPAQFTIAVDIYLLPRKTAAAGKLGKALLHHLAKMASLARVNHHLAGFRHGGIVALTQHPLARKNHTGDPHQGPVPQQE
jgi:hypothetical protein